MTQTVNPLARLKFLTSLHLKILAIIFMVCDHAWATIVPGNDWLTHIGRLAFPIFAFQLVEGFSLSHNRKKYLLRMFIWALISEIPFNLMTGEGPFHQNVLFTFCEGILWMMLLEAARQKGRWQFLAASVAAIIGGYILGILTFVDYNGYGILMILLFYYTRMVPHGWILQLIGMIYINCILMGGLVYPVTLFGMSVDIPEQGLAVFSLPLIWLYNGKRGFDSKTIQIGCYAFYPLHILVLVIMQAFLWG